MKKPLFLITFVSTLLALASVVEARLFIQVGNGRHGHCHSNAHYYGSHYITKRVLVGYDCYRRPIFRYVRVPVHHRGYSSGGYYPHHRGYYGRSSRCSSVRRVHSPYTHSYVSSRRCR